VTDESWLPAVPDEPVLLGSAEYRAKITPLRSGGRRDVEVTTVNESLPEAFGRSDIVAHLRRFFDLLDAEAHSHEGDPVALSQALARLEALAADIRFVKDTVRRLTAEALAAERVRRLTVSGVATVEATTEVSRSEWRHRDLLSKMLDVSALVVIDGDTGVRFDCDEAADLILAWFRPEWRMTPLREAGVDPDDFCAVATDEAGRPARTPSVRMVDNLTRRSTTP